jgi:muconolactone delta-isomerase
VEYLVTMTTDVPEGTSDETVQDMRNREKARSQELAAEGHLLRLWRPPLQPGEWRSLGLFAGDDRVELEMVLASMPLRVWRTDEVVPLWPHPNDPGVAHADPDRAEAEAGRQAVEFLTIFTVTVPSGTSAETVDDIEAREAQRAHELAEQGRLLRLWMLPAEPGDSRALGLWQADDGAEMEAILRSLPLDQWMTVETTPLTEHPNDPALIRG